MSKINRKRDERERERELASPTKQIISLSSLHPTKSRFRPLSRLVELTARRSCARVALIVHQLRRERYNDGSGAIDYHCSARAPAPLAGSY